MLIDKLKQRFGADILVAEEARGEETIVIPRERATDIFRALHDEPDFAFDALSDLSAVDWPERSRRFEVVYHLNSITRQHRLRAKVQIDPDGPEAWVNRVTGIWKAA